MVLGYLFMYQRRIRIFFDAMSSLFYRNLTKTGQVYKVRPLKRHLP
jgi:hypothetical protein